jgi:hypothetical protein
VTKHVDFITIVYFSNLSKFGHTDSLPLVPKHMNSLFILYMHIHFPNFLLIMQNREARRARLRAPEFVAPAWQLEERETELGATQVRCWSSTFFKLQRNAALPPATFAPYYHPRPCHPTTTLSLARWTEGSV